MKKLVRVEAEIVIVGAGYAGLTLALQLRRQLPGCTIWVLDKRPHPAPESAHKVGESLVEVSSWYLREELQLGSHLVQSHLPKFGLRFFMSEESNEEIHTRPEYGLLQTPVGIPNISYESFEGIHLPTYNVDRGRLENHLLECCLENGIQVYDQCKVKSITLRDPHEIIMESRGTSSKVSARWVIDASGRSGVLAHDLEIRRFEEHRINAVWFRLEGRIDPEQWSDSVSFNERAMPGLRWLSTNHLMGDGYWIWIIPLPNNATSVGIVVDPCYHSMGKIDRFDKALAWLKDREFQLASEIDLHDRLDFKVLKAQAYRSTRILSTDRWALTGEAAFFIDALYSPGADFIAVTNTLIVQMVQADLAGDRLRLALLSRFGEQVLNGMYRQYMGLYKGSYSLMRHAALMQQKVAWDSAVYFGYNVLLFCNRQFCNPDFHRNIRSENMKLGQLQQMMRYRLRKQSLDECRPRSFVDQGALEPIQKLYWSSYGSPGKDELKTRLQQNLEILDHFGKHIEEMVA